MAEGPEGGYKGQRETGIPGLVTQGSASAEEAASLRPPADGVQQPGGSPARSLLALGPALPPLPSPPPPAPRKLGGELDLCASI